MPFPSPDTVHPVRMPDGTVIKSNVFLKAVIDHPRFEVGDYTYASDFDPPEDPSDWAARLAPFLFPISPDRLVIGKFGQFAHGVRFITHSANHAMSGFSTFPFAIHDPDRFMGYAASFPRGADTIIGNDVWIGMDAKIMPGSHIGSGAIIGAGSVVAGNIPDYAIAAGNPARVIRMRFDDDTISRLLKLAWWDWPIEQILAQEEAVVGADIERLERACAER